MLTHFPDNMLTRINLTFENIPKQQPTYSNVTFKPREMLNAVGLLQRRGVLSLPEQLIQKNHQELSNVLECRGISHLHGHYLV